MLLPQKAAAKLLESSSGAAKAIYLLHSSLRKVVLKNKYLTVLSSCPYAWLLITFSPKVSIFFATVDWILLPVSLPGRWYFARSVPELFEICSQLKDETCPPLPLAPQEPDSPPMAMAMCANGIKIRLRTGNFFFCHHNLNRPAKKFCINCRATDSHSSKTNANKYSKKYTKIVCSPAHFDFASKKGLCNWWQNFRNKYWAHKSFCWISFIMHYGPLCHRSSFNPLCDVTGIFLAPQVL